MRRTIMLPCDDGAGNVQTVEVPTLERDVEPALSMLGLLNREVKLLLLRLRQRFVRQQAAAFNQHIRPCSKCGIDRNIMDCRPRTREWKNPELSGCESRRRKVVQSTVQHRGTHGGYAMRASRRPAHAPALGHPGVGDLVDRRFGARGRDRPPRPVAGAVVDERAFVVGQVDAQVLAVKQKHAYRRAEVVPVEVDRLAGRITQRPQCLTRLGGVAFPDQVAKPFDVDADEVEAGLVRRPQGVDAGQRLLDVAYPH